MPQGYPSGGLGRRPIDLTFSEALQRSGSEPGHLRVVAFRSFTQLLDRLRYLPPRRKNRSQIQPRLREIRAQPDSFPILPRGLGHLLLSREKAP